MKIELYLVPDDIEGKLIKEFLVKHKLSFKEIITNNINVLRKVTQNKYLRRKISLLKITYSSSIHIITGFIKHDLNQLLEHIKKYKPKITIQ